MGASNYADRMKQALLSALVFFCAPATLAQQNAADDYNRIMESWEDIDEESKILLEYLPTHLEPCDDALAAMRTLDPMDRLLLQGSGKKDCDFGIDLSEGPGVLLPHLGPMMGVTRYTLTRITWQRMQGRHDEATRRLASLYALAFHMGQEGTLIGSLVAQSIFTRCDESVGLGIEEGSIGPAEARLLLAELDVEGDDPFGAIQSIRNEKEYFGGWVERQLEEALQPDGSIVLTDDMKDIFSTFEVSNQEEWMEAFRDANMEGYYRFMDDSIEAFEMDDPTAARARQAKFDQALEQGDYGDFARILAPTVGMVMQRTHENIEALGKRMELLKEIAGETVDPLDGANAAWWYIRAARMIEQLSPEDDRSAVLDELLVATLIEECTFPGFDEDAFPQPVVPPWSTGLSRCFDLLLEQAREALDAGNIDTCIARLVVGLEMAADLSANPSIVDSIIAQDAVTGLLGMGDSLDSSGQLDARQRRLLLEAIRGIPARDPFGYMQAADASRRLVSGYVGMYDPLQAHAASFPSDPDGILYTIAWSEEAVETGYPHSFCWPLATDWQVLEGQVDGAAVLEARSHGIDAREAAKLDVMVEIEPVHTIALPTIDQRRREGATVLRDWKRRLDQ